MRNFEIQLGHLCNDRCLFCISGQLTHQRRAPILESQLLVERVRAARDAGYDRLTLLGGEPTIQPAFLPVVEQAAQSGFKEIVIFSNGSRLARTDLVDRILATGGTFEFRFSFQGGTPEAHEATTRRKGSFDQLIRAAEHVGARGQKVTINTVLTRANYCSVPELASVVRRCHAVQLHLDVINPYDVPVLEDDELQAMQVRYSELGPPLLELIKRLPRGFDVNVGNLPACAALAVAPWIHHGGPTTWTVSAAVDGRRVLPIEKDKYDDKGSRKQKRDACQSCLLSANCAGYFARYSDWFGEDDFDPVTRLSLSRLADQETRLPDWARIYLALDALRGAADHFLLEPIAQDAVRVALLQQGTRVVATVSTSVPSPHAKFAGGGVVLESHVGDLVRVQEWLARLNAACGESQYPPAEDAIGVQSPLQGRLDRLRTKAPFPELKWSASRLSETALECDFESADGLVQLWWRLTPDGVRGGYRAPDAPQQRTVDAIRGLLQALGKADVS